MKVCAGVKKHYINNYLKLSDVKFYACIASFTLFTKLHENISPFVRQLWKGPKDTLMKTKQKFRQLDCVPNLMGPSRKLLDFDQFLLMLIFMKIRLNIQCVI